MLYVALQQILVQRESLNPLYLFIFYPQVIIFKLMNLLIFHPHFIIILISTHLNINVHQCCPGVV